MIDKTAKMCYIFRSESSDQTPNNRRNALKRLIVATAERDNGQIDVLTGSVSNDAQAAIGPLVFALRKNGAVIASVLNQAVVLTVPVAEDRENVFWLDEDGYSHKLIVTVHEDEASAMAAHAAATERADRFNASTEGAPKDYWP